MAWHGMAWHAWHAYMYACHGTGRKWDPSQPTLPHLRGGQVRGRFRRADWSEGEGRLRLQQAGGRQVVWVRAALGGVGEVVIDPGAPAGQAPRRACRRRLAGLVLPPVQHSLALVQADPPQVLAAPRHRAQSGAAAAFLLASAPPILGCLQCSLLK